MLIQDTPPGNMLIDLTQRMVPQCLMSSYFVDRRYARHHVSSSYPLLPVSIVASSLLGAYPSKLSMQFVEVLPLPSFNPSSLSESPVVHFHALASV